jgi:hypothetical protein
MWFPSLFGRRPSRPAPPPARAGRQARPSARPAVEALEDRTVPAFLEPLSFTGLPVAAGDFNNDGMADLLATDGVLLSQGDGTFQAAASIALDLHPVVGDFDGDGNLDVATSENLFLGLGDGTFQPARPLPSMKGGGKLAAGDVNGDGNLDLVMLGHVFEERKSSGGKKETLWSLDGTTKVYVNVLLGAGDGNFAALKPKQIYSLSNWWELVHFKLGDFTGDGQLDILTTHQTSKIGSYTTQVNLLAGNGTGAFRSPSAVAKLEGLNYVQDPLAVGDFNGDGALDFAVLHTSSPGVHLFLQEAGKFGAAAFVAVDQWPQTIVVADVNGDGRLDLVTTSKYTQSVNVLLGNGDGTFQAIDRYPLGTDEPYRMVAGDVDGDGYPDLIVSVWYDVGGMVLLNDGVW